MRQGNAMVEENLFTETDALLYDQLEPSCMKCKGNTNVMRFRKLFNDE